MPAHEPAGPGIELHHHFGGFVDFFQRFFYGAGNGLVIFLFEIAQVFADDHVYEVIDDARVFGLDQQTLFQ